MTYTRTITISFTVEVVGEVITDIKELIQQVQTEGRQELYSQFWWQLKMKTQAEEQFTRLMTSSTYCILCQGLSITVGREGNSHWLI